MRLIKASELSKTLNISRHTVKTWCKRIPGLAVKRGRCWYLRADKLAECQGLDIVKVLTLDSQRWVKAVDLAGEGRPRRTIAHWCKTRPHLAMRIGRIWYIDLEQLGASDEQADVLRKWAPHQKTAIAFLSTAAHFEGDGGKNESER